MEHVAQPADPTAGDEQRRVFVFGGAHVAPGEIRDKVLTRLIAANFAVQVLEFVEHLHDEFALAGGKKIGRIAHGKPDRVHICFVEELRHACGRIRQIVEAVTLRRRAGCRKTQAIFA